MRRRLPLVALAGLLAVATPAIAVGTGAHHFDGKDKGKHGHGWVPPADDHWAGHGTDPTNPAGCDPIDDAPGSKAPCMLPYPNDWFTKDDPSSATGRRLDLNALGMPRNAEGKPIEPQEWNRSDGFSAGAQILTYVPGMTSNADLVPSGLPPVTDLGMNDRSKDLGVVLLDTVTGEKWPVWTEIDQYTDTAGPTPSPTIQQDLMIHPAVNLTDGHRYIVALRHLHTDPLPNGEPGPLAEAPPAFKAYRDGTAPDTDPRKKHMENLFATLKQAGVARDNLYLAWDFTTASTKNVTGRLLAMRDDAFAQLGDTTLDDGIVQGDAPKFTVESVEDNPDTNIAKRITGHFTVPCYLAPTCDPPAKCNLDPPGFDDCPTPGQFALDPTNPDATPTNTGTTYSANFICNVGKTSYDAHQQMRPVEYGHGLFGGAGEVNSGPQRTMADQHGMLYCATDWTGMASADVPNAVIALHDLSRFPFLTDRVQQGELNFLYLARLMVHPDGFSSAPEFQWSDGTPFIDTTAAYYDGNSQGGIYGGTVCAVSVDVRRCVLGVPGMDYSILLPRSSDYVAQKKVTEFDPQYAIEKALEQSPDGVLDQIGYSTLLDTSYPDQSQRMLILDLIQTLWDRSDPNGYASHMTDGLPGTPHHDVLLHVGYGDHQVANITAETEARTIGAHGFAPPLVTARYADYKDPFWGIPAIDGSWSGSAITLFDTGPADYERAVPEADGGGTHRGTDPPPTADVPNRSGEDPHEAPRRAACGQQQKDLFLRVDGAAVATCGGAPYFAWGWDGVTGL